MKKIIFSISLTLFTISLVFGKKINEPYCFQGDYTENSTKVWCIIPNSTDENPTFSYQKNGMSIQVKGTWENYKNFTYGQMDIQNLNPNSDYTLQYQQNDILNFKTRDIHKDTTSILVGSCAMMTFGWYWILRPKIKYSIFDHMTATPNDAMLWMGDNVYFLFKEPYSDNKQIKKYIRTRRVPQLAHFLQSTPQYAIWDDHDFGPNNSDGTFPFKEFSLKNFQDFWVNPSPVDIQDGIYYPLHFPHADVFMTDNRYHALEGKQFYSQTQKDWLCQSLKASTAPFKIIITGDQVNNPYTNQENLSMTGEFDSIIEFVKKEKITGVVFVDGDRHHSEMFKHHIEGVYPIYEFTNSSLTSLSHKVRKGSAEFHNPARIQGPTRDHVFGKITIAPASKEGVWICTLSTINKKGKLLWEVQISSDELKWEK